MATETLLLSPWLGSDRMRSQKGGKPNPRPFLLSSSEAKLQSKGLRFNL